MCVGIVHMKVNAISVEVPTLAVFRWVAKWTYFHRIYHGSLSKWYVGVEWCCVCATVCVFLSLYSFCDQLVAW